MRVLVTGATGFLGRPVARLLLDRGWEVVGTSRDGRDDTVALDLLDPVAVRDALHDVRPTHLVHAAWLPVRSGVMNAEENIAWLQASLGLVRQFHESGGVRAAVVGSSAEYDWTDGRCVPGTTPLRPATIYGACKHALHVALDSYARLVGLGLVWTRVFFVFGPGEHETRLVASVVRALVRGEPALCTAGTQRRDYVFVEDVATGIVDALVSDHNGAVDLASGVDLAVRDLVLELAGLMGRPDLVQLGARPMPVHDAPLVVGDPTVARRVLGWEPTTTIADGLASTIAWGRTRRSACQRLVARHPRRGRNEGQADRHHRLRYGWVRRRASPPRGGSASGPVRRTRPTAGGHTSTHFYDDGFTFDEGPHISFTSERRLQDMLSGNIGGEYEVMKAYVNNYWRGHWIKHPAQINLHGLPTDVVVACIRDFVAASEVEEPPISNYEDWLLAAYGETFARTFPMEYTKKYHTTEAKNLTTDWLGPRLYRPSLDEVLIGALEPEPLDVHYVDHFRYPTRGGFVAYLRPFERLVDLRCDHRLEQIDAEGKTLEFANGATVPYDQLITSVPLPLLISMIEQAPPDVQEAASLLACSQVVLVNIGINRPIETSAQWTYFYDDDICFARLSFPPHFSSTMVPRGCGSIQAEVYFSEKWRPLPNAPQDWIEPTIDGLLQCGLIRSRDEVVHRSVIFAPFANVIFDLDRPNALETVHGFLDDLEIRYCGRYGDWAYIWTDQAFMSGERAAEAALAASR